MNVEIKGVESNAVALGLMVTTVIIKIMNWLAVWKILEIMQGEKNKFKVMKI